MRNKIKTNPKLPPSPQVQFHSFISDPCTSSLLSGAGGQGMGDALVHSYHFVSAALSSSVSSPFSSVASLQWDTVLHKVLQNTNTRTFPWAAVLQECLQHGFFPKEYSPAGTDCSCVCAAQATVLPKACSCMDFSPQAAAPAGSLFCGLCAGCSFFRSISTCPGMGSSVGCRRISSAWKHLLPFLLL